IWRPVLLIGSAGAAAILSTIIKSITINSRPITDNMIAPFETDYSFPSGHTIIVVTFLLVLGYMICSRNSNLARIIIWEIIVVVGFVLIATSRLYLGYHWLTDVTASLGLGLIILGASIFVDIIISKYIKN
ncbi:phosphatase PAP2 family protein, partial [Candidatus Saccharibacteria bacterium]|nr:phosphatase PAP2 family protein [Candidatus Saccharibacteria bacterium]